MLSFKNFTERVAKEIRDYLPGSGKDYSVTTTQTRKVNEGTVTMVSVRKEGEAVGTCIPVSAVYEDYKKSGLDFSVFFQDYAAQFTGRMLTMNDEVMQQASMVQNMDWNKISHMVYVHAIGASRNEELLKNVPHKQMGDVCAVYRIHLGENSQGRASVLITDDIAKQLRVSPEELHQTAVHNSMGKYPAICVPMSDIIGEMLGGDSPMMDDPAENTLYVLTNREKMDGAGVIFYPDVMDAIYKNMPENCYLLPSSVHEWLVVSKNKAEKEDLEYMVRSINETEVDPKEQLSDMVHEYDPVRKLVYAGTMPDPPRQEMTVAEKAWNR